MKKRTMIVAASLLCSLILTLAGCKSKSGSSASVDETKPIAEVKAEAEKMDVEQLRAAALNYQKAIQAKEPEVQKLAEQIKAIPLTELMGEKATTLKADMEKVSKSIAALKERMQVYVDQLKARNGDLTGLNV